MKKIIKRIKKIFFMVGMFCIYSYTKVLSAIAIDPAYGIPREVLETQLDYGVPSTGTISALGKVARSLIIPIVFIIGTIIYIKRSSSSTIRKIITIIIALIIVVLVCLGINHIISNI